MYEEGTYPNRTQSGDLIQFRVVQGETDLLVCCDKDIPHIADAAVKKIRIELTRYTAQDPAFETSYKPIKPGPNAPQIVKDIIRTTAKAGLGPIAGVGGAMAEYAGKEILKAAKQVIVENGGCIFIRSDIPRTVSLFTKDADPSGKLSIEVDPEDTPIGICVLAGASLNSPDPGVADAVLVSARSAVAAGAAAAVLSGIIKKERDIEAAMEAAKKMRNIKGALLVKGDRMGIWGKVKLIGI